MDQVLSSIPAIKALVRGCYRLQDSRIQIGNRLVGNFKRKFQVEKGTTLTAAMVMQPAREDFYHIKGTRKKVVPRQFEGFGLIDDYTEYSFIQMYEHAIDEEKFQHKNLAKLIQEEPLWNEFLSEVKGCGPLMTGVILSELDPHKAPYPSSFWRYTGLDVASDGAGRSRRKEHLIDVEYEDSNGETQTKKSITFNPFIRTKLLGVLAPSFLKLGKDKESGEYRSPYAKTYYEYKHRLEHHEKYKDVSAGHRHNMAVRYMIKRFLVDLHLNWRRIEGLSVSEEYSVAKLGKVHRGGANG